MLNDSAYILYKMKHSNYKNKASKLQERRMIRVLEASSTLLEDVWLAELPHLFG